MKIIEPMEAPSQFLNRILEHIHQGKALDIAAGRGRNSIFLARNGFEVDGIELSDESIAEFKSSLEKLGLNVQIIQADLERSILPDNRYDLIICFFYLQRDLFPAIHRALKTGGFVVYETFLIDQHLKFGSPKRKEFCLGHNELLSFFKGFRIHFYEEGVGENQKITARIIAQKI